ncbi:hypothetical protein PFISCL1PPCAC_3482, partial [Pristionchus fissidentatus]
RAGQYRTALSAVTVDTLLTILCRGIHVSLPATNRDPQYLRNFEQLTSRIVQSLPILSSFCTLFPASKISGRSLHKVG